MLNYSDSKSKSLFLSYLFIEEFLKNQHFEVELSPDVLGAKISDFTTPLTFLKSVVKIYFTLDMGLVKVKNKKLENDPIQITDSKQVTKRYGIL